MFDIALPSPRPRAERQITPPRKGDGALDMLARPLRPLRARLEQRRVHAILPALDTLAPQMAAQDMQALVALARGQGAALRKPDDWGPAPTGPLAQTLAATREILARISGRRLYDVQMLGAYAMLRGNVAQMATGEGKTLTAALCAAVAGLAGHRAHVITVNDYLTARDHEIGEPLFQALGLTSGAVVEGMELPQRQDLYASDITYCTAKELAFDYLRDRLLLGQQDSALHLKLAALRGAKSQELRLQGLHFAIVDEADSVLIDEARTPLVISANVPGGVTREEATIALDLARSMQEAQDYLLNRAEAQIRLTNAGRTKLRDATAGLGGNWRGRVRREEMARQALNALHLFHLGDQYILQEGKVVIVAESTGRAMPDRSWSGGLQQMIETKENCAEISSDRHNIGQITYQRLFRRYLRLGGLTGTTQGVRAEMWSTYRLNVVDIPTHRPVIRVHHPDRIYPDDAARWQGVIARIRELHQAGLPVLLGTRSVADCRLASTALQAAGLPHRLLSAEEDAAEAEVVAEAGQAGRITVVTAMAGRGTDIAVPAEVAARGGLHVIVVNRLEARRIEAQFAGRAGRQGQAGAYEMHLSLEDPMLANALPPLRAMAAKCPALCHGALGARLLSHAAARLERRHSAMRRALLTTDREQSRVLAFAGRGE